MIKVALFPIPNSVNFPGVPLSLHVFEPRYRKMVKHCIKHDMLMGVCHTQKVLHEKNREQSRKQTKEEILSSNQSTYKPCDIFSAGPVVLLEEFEDGRMAIQVNANMRLRLKNELQTLPFSIWECEELSDHAISDDEMAALTQGKEKILRRLIKITHDSEEIQKILSSDYWHNMSPVQFSFAVNGLLGMDAELQQELLENQYAQQRMGIILELVNSIDARLLE